MDPDRTAIAWTRTLLDLPEEIGERFHADWTIVRHRIEVVQSVPLARETEPAGGPRLSAGDG